MNLSEKENRRRLAALCRIADAKNESRPWLGSVVFDGESVYATDLYVAGTLPYKASLPDDRVALPAPLLAKALGLVSGEETCQLEFGDDTATLHIGEETLDGFDDPTTVTIAYEDVDDYPNLDQYLNPGPDLEPTPVSLNAAYLAKLAALVKRGEGNDDRVTIAPRGPSLPVDVYAVPHGQRVGVLMPVRLGQ